MKFTLIFKEALQRPRFVDVDAKSFDVITKSSLPERYLADMVFLYGVVDYQSSKVIPAAFDLDGGVMMVPDGDFGEPTTAQDFREMSS